MTKDEERIGNAVDALVASNVEREGSESRTVERECQKAFGDTGLAFQRSLGIALAKKVSKKSAWTAALLIFSLGVQVGRHLVKAEELERWVG